MKKLTLTGLMLLCLCAMVHGQKELFLGVETFQGASWSSKPDYESRYNNSMGFYLDYKVLDGFYLGTGIGVNKFGHQRTRIEDFIVIEGQGIEGEILTKRSYKIRFWHFPLRATLRLFKTGTFELMLHQSASLNIYRNHFTQSWYWYATDQEVEDYSGYSSIAGGGYSGAHIGLTSSLGLRKYIFKRWVLQLDVQYQHLYFEARYPYLPEKFEFSNLGGSLALRYNLIKPRSLPDDH